MLRFGGSKFGDNVMRFEEGSQAIPSGPLLTRKMREGRRKSNLNPASVPIWVFLVLVGSSSIDKREGVVVRRSYDLAMEKKTRPAASSTNSKKKSQSLGKIKSVLLNSSSLDTGKGRSKQSCTKMTHEFHLVEGKSGHDMEDYHVAEYRRDKNHELGLFAIFDGHLGDGVRNFLRNEPFQQHCK